MAVSYKDIIITPNRGSATTDPQIAFQGGNATANTAVTLRVYPDANGTLSFEGSAGQLFSITNDLTGSIFSVNDVSGVPSIDVNADGTISLARYSGNVGIGTSSPGDKLTVTSGNMRIDNSNSGFLSFWSGTGFFGGIGTTGAILVDSSNDIGIRADTNRAIRFYTNGANERVRIDSSGNVGIGTSSPSTKLDVNGNTLASNYVLPNDGYLYWGVGDGSAFVRGNSSSDYVSFGTVGVERMRIDSSGNVGIGNTAPGSKLTVAGRIESTTGGVKFPDGTTQTSAGASTGKAIAMAIVFGG